MTDLARNIPQGENTAESPSWHVLKPHPQSLYLPDCRPEVLLYIAADHTLNVRFSLTGDQDRLLLPALVKMPHRCDGLWQHSCFELFIAGPDTRYREFNFSPSGCWNAYTFSRYRQRQTGEDQIKSLVIDIQRCETQFVLTAALSSDALPPAGRNGYWRVGLSAVIETRDGSLSYWALRHPAKQPDFHLRKGFVLSLADKRFF